MVVIRIFLNDFFYQKSVSSTVKESSLQGDFVSIYYIYCSFSYYLTVVFNQVKSVRFGSYYVTKTFDSLVLKLVHGNQKMMSDAVHAGLSVKQMTIYYNVPNELDIKMRSIK